MYDHFKRKFFNIIEAYGRARLEHEKQILKNETHIAKVYCQSKTPEETCKYYKMPEGKLLNVVRKRQEKERIDNLFSLGHFDRFIHRPTQKKPR